MGEVFEFTVNGQVQRTEEESRCSVICAMI